MDRDKAEVKEEAAIIPNVVGFGLKKALQQIAGQTGIPAESIRIKTTAAPFEDKKRERQGNEPVVVRQVVSGNEITLTTSIFK